MKRVFAVLILCTGLTVAGWYSPVGEPFRCSFQLREGLTFEMPDTGVSLREYRAKIENVTGGCGDVVLRSGVDSDGAIVTCCGGDSHNITSGNREVYVSTSPTDLDRLRLRYVELTGQDGEAVNPIDEIVDAICKDDPSFRSALDQLDPSEVDTFIDQVRSTC